MVRLAFRGAVAVLWVTLAMGCLGGQTGQPASLDCGSTPSSASAAWRGTTVAEAARAFEGTYAAGLLWYEEPRNAASHTTVQLQDSVQLSLAYTGGKATQYDCVEELKVPVSVTLTGSSSGLAESGKATLTIQPSSHGLVGSLHYESPSISFDATLHELASGAAPVASFDVFDPNLPGASAIFTEEP
jgi:hypothetical protein